jgi:predicted porin
MGSAYRIEYTAGPLNVNYAVSNRNDQNEQKGVEVTVYGATYQAGPYKLVGAQAKTKHFNNMASLHDLTVTGVGVIYDVNAKTDVAFGYTTMKDDEDSAYKTTLIGLTGRYKFSARTLAYAGYGTGKNTGSSNKQTVFYGGPASTTAGGVNSAGLLVGLRHSF